MSSEALKILAQKILENIEDSADYYTKDGKSSENRRKGVRFLLQGLPGQLLIINKADFLTELDSILREKYSSNGAVFTSLKNKIWNNLDTEYLSKVASRYKSRIPEVKMKALEKRQAEINRSRSKKAFIVSNFYQAKTGVKTKHLPEIIVNALVEYGLIGKESSAAVHKEIAKLVGGAEDSGFHIGHGVDVGIAVSGIRGLKAEALYDQLINTAGLSAKERKELDRYFRSFRRSVGILKLDRSNVLDAKGNLTSSYIVELNLQQKMGNLRDASLEKGYLNALRDSFKNIRKQEGSTSIDDGVNQIIAGTLHSARGKGVRVTTASKPKKSIKEKSSSGPIKAKVGKEKEATISNFDQVIPGSWRRGKLMLSTQTKTGRTVNRSLLTILNQTLKTVVAENMILPRLQFRTGRFANSVNVVSVVEGARGVPDITYTYMHDPYDVFRMDIGSQLATPNRDPRFIIDLSIRQIAAKFAIRKLISRPA